MLPGRRLVVAGLVLLSAVVHGLICAEGQGEEDGRLRFHLKVSPPVVPSSAEERREHYRAVEAKDLLRHRQMVGGGAVKRRQAWDMMMSNTSKFELPMRSALNIANVGMYIVSVRIGTPALPYNLVLDTANELTWINCRLRRRRGKHPGRPHVKKQSPTANTLSLDAAGSPVKVIKNWYRPALSSSWRRFRCSQPVCGLLPYNTCLKPFNQTTSCTYRQRVQDGTITDGIYGQEKATVSLSRGRMVKLPGLVIGCSTYEAGGAVDTHDGVLALGNGDISFGNIAASRFGNRFSFCLLATASGRNASSYLTFGPNPDVRAAAVMETPIVYRNDMPAYGVTVTRILVAGKPLPIPPEVWDHNHDDGDGGVILDTGTSITSLLPEAYAAVTTALHRHLGHLPRNTEVIGFEFCYNWTFAGDGVDPAHNVTIPKLVVELDGGARLQPDAKSIVMPEVVPGVACLGFRRLPYGPAIIGNVLMQEHVWEFDHMNRKLRFRKDKCLPHDH